APITVQGVGVRPESGMFVPIVFGGQAVGVLSVQSERTDAYDTNDQEALETCALYLGALMHDEAQRREAERFAQMVSTDGLTGVGSRRHFDVVLEKERRRCEREQAPLSTILIDVDHFKTFNDAYGHVAGDTCLRQVAMAAANCAGRPGDVFARYGGEEFAVILPWTDLGGAIKVAERMRQAVYALAIPHEGSSLQRVTVSVGVSTGVPGPACTCEGIVQQTDEWLYRAKESGRNRVAALSYDSATESADRKKNVPHNVPEPRTSFVGRVEDVNRVRALLESDRLVSVVGPGGSGKTRTIIETARTLLDSYPDGVWFIDLAPLGDAGSLVVTIASTVRVGGIGTDDIAQLGSRLAARRMLLVLDNCEHVVEPCAALVDSLLDAAPDLHVLVTSREPLGISGERVYRLPMLVPEDAVELFVERARQGGVRFAGDNRETIERIVQRLDGMPLAIELAAARLTVMSPDDLLRRLDDCLNLLRPSSRALPSRQQTLRALIDWSYRLLSEPEQRLFLRLAVFPASWSLDAIAPVCGGGMDEMEALVAKSLVERSDDAGASRFRLLNVTREYAMALLEQSGEEEALVASFARYFAELAMQRGEMLAGMPMREWLGLQRPERENYQVALRWCFGAQGDILLGSRMLAALRPWFHVRGRVDFVELLPLFETLLASRELPAPAAAAVSLAAADLFGNHDLLGCLQCAKRALELFTAVGDDLGYAEALERLGTVQRYVQGGVDPDLEEPVRTSIEVAKRHGARRLAAILLRLLSDIYSNKADDASLAMEREVILEACELLRECGDEERSGSMLARVAVAAFWAGDLEDARNTCRAAITLMEQAEEPWNVGFQLMNLGLYETFREDFTAARVALQKSTELLHQYGHQYAFANIFVCYAVLAHRTGQPERAVRLFAHADGLFADGPRQQIRLTQLQEDLSRELRETLGFEAFERAWIYGRRMSAQQALHEAEEL
ncbi:MAG TPA: diguanylate cyclase, partial [Candidatus Baltobacteraceae bacterium]|nr:diguanylate cyclase [Candidatus Baltobacteraceae bacterium]